MAEFTTKEDMYKVLDVLSEKLSGDEQFLKRIERASISMLLEASDIGARYGVFLEKGVFTGKVEPEDKTSFSVVAKASTIDKLLSGKLNGESAYMAGAINLRGSEYTAESMLSYMPFIVRAYKAATE